MRKSILFIMFIFLIPLIGNSFTFEEDVVQIKEIPESGIMMEQCWKFQTGDDPAYALPDYDDSHWEAIDPTLDLYYLPQIRSSQIGWLRIHLQIDSTLLNKPLAFQIRQHLATEIYINGETVKQYGVVSTDPQTVEAFQPQYEPFGIQFTNPDVVVAVRFSFQPNLPYFKFNRRYNGLTLRMDRVEGAYAYAKHQTRYDRFDYIEGGVFLLLFLIHLSFFMVYPKQKANLFFALATFFVGIGHFLVVATTQSHDVAYITYVAVVTYILRWSLYGLFLFLAVHTLFSSRRGYTFWFVVALFPLGIPFLFITYNWGVLLGILFPTLIGTAEAFRISFLAYRKGTRGVSIVLAGLAGYFIFFSLFFIMGFGILPYGAFNIGGPYVIGDLVFHLSVVSIPISLSIYLSLQYAYTTKDLKKKLREVQLLSDKTIAQEQEKNRFCPRKKKPWKNRLQNGQPSLTNPLKTSNPPKPSLSNLKKWRHSVSLQPALPMRFRIH